MLLQLTGGNKMPTYRFRLLLLSLVCFFLSAEVFASAVVQSEFEMLLPRSFQQNLIDQVWRNLQSEQFNLSWSLPDQTYATPDVTVVGAGLTLEVHTMLQKPALGGGGDTITLTSKNLEANLNLKKISLDQYIERNVGGIIGRFRVQAECDDVNFHMKPGQGTFTMTLSPVFDKNIVTAHVDDADMTWTTDAWEVTALKCTGAEGFEDLIRDEVLKVVADSKIVQEQKVTLTKYVQDYVNSKSIDFGKARTLTTSRPDITATMTVSEFAGTEDNAIVRGLMRVNFAKASSDKNKILKLGSGIVTDAKGASAVLRLPESFVVDVTEAAFSGNSWKYHVSSKDIPGFSSLMDSRFTQFFVWRELMDFPKATEFFFDIYSPKDIDVSGKNLSYKLGAPLWERMSAPRDGKYWPFMTFATPLTSDVKMSLSRGVVGAKLTNVSMGLKEYWDPVYDAKYYANKTFAADTIRKRIVKAMEGTSLTYTLPKIPISESLSLTVDSVTPTKSGDLLFYLNQAAVPTPASAGP